MIEPTGAKILTKYLPPKPLIGCEVGVLRGANAAALLLERPGLLLHLVDHWDHGGLVEDSPASIRKQARQALAPFHEQCIWHEFDSLQTATMLPVGYFDFVYLDSNHSAEHLAVEIAVWLPRVKDGGLLAGHDYGHERFPGVAEAVDCNLSGVKVDRGVWLKRV